MNAHHPAISERIAKREFLYGIRLLNWGGRNDPAPSLTERRDKIISKLISSFGYLSTKKDSADKVQYTFRVGDKEMLQRIKVCEQTYLVMIGHPYSA